MLTGDELFYPLGSEENLLKPNVSYKRFNDAGCSLNDKKMKLENKYALEKSNGNISLSNLLDDPNNTSNMPKTNVNKFDAFAKFMTTTSLSDQMLPSHYSNTGSVKEIDCLVESGNNECSNEKLKSDISNPILKSFKAKLDENIDKTNMSILNRSMLFENETTTTHFKNKVDCIFDQIENSIYSMGNNNGEVSVPEEILDIIFCDDLHLLESEVENVNNAKHGCDKLNAACLDSSFGTVIKKVLINNAGKLIHPNKHFETTLYRTLTEETPKFDNLGPFYGLPLEVKTLVMKYKGIEELYGTLNYNVFLI